MRIDQMVVGASPGDAITSFAQSLQRLLAPQVPSDLYARYYPEDLAGAVKSLHEYGARPGGQADDLLVLHVSIGEPEVADLVLARPERLVLIYHNISPSEPFRPYDTVFADLLDQGRAELASLRERATAVLTVSEFNALELRALGFSQVTVLPLIVDREDLTATPCDAALAERLTHELDGPIILAVGQVLPHKRVEYLVQAFHILSTYLVRDARLIVVGAQRLAGYASTLQSEIDDLHLDRIWLTGSVSQPMLAAFLRRANLFATASEHEGFCAPLLEAMAFDVPIQGRRFAAVPETAGGAGLILDPGDGPAVAAEAWQAVLGDDELRSDLVARGNRRLADFDAGRTKEAWCRALLALV